MPTKSEGERMLFDPFVYIPLLAVLLPVMFCAVNFARWRMAVANADLPQRVYYCRLAVGCGLLVVFMALGVFSMPFLGRFPPLEKVMRLIQPYLSLLCLAFGLWFLSTAWFFRWRARRRVVTPPSANEADDHTAVWPPPPTAR